MIKELEAVLDELQEELTKEEKEEIDYLISINDLEEVIYNLHDNRHISTTRRNILLDILEEYRLDV